jgi:hypothetical protein
MWNKDRYKKHSHKPFFERAKNASDKEKDIIEEPKKRQ